MASDDAQAQRKKHEGLKSLRTSVMFNLEKEIDTDQTAAGSSIKDDIPTMADDEGQATDFHVIVFRSSNAPNQPLGVSLDRQLYITQVEAHSLSTGKFKFGDQVLEVGDEPVQELEQCVQLVKAGLLTATAENPLKFKVRRWKNPGIRQVTFTTDANKALGFALDHYLHIGQVTEGSPADGRLKVGDAVLAIDGVTCTGVTQAMTLITSHDPTKPLTIKIRRTPGSSGPAPISVEVKRNGDEPLGVYVNTHLLVTYIQYGSPVDGKLAINDQILAVNDKTVVSGEELVAALATVGSTFKLTIRPMEGNELDRIALPNSLHESHIDRVIPQKRENYVTRKPGFDYFLVTIVYKKDKKVGISMRSENNKVFVVKVEKDSLAYGFLKAHDRLVDIDGQPQVDKEAAKNAMLMAMKKYRRFTSVVERPVIADAKQQQTAQSVMHQIIPSAYLPPDAQHYAKEHYDAKKKDGVAQPQKAIISKPGEMQKANIAYKDEHVEVPVARDAPLTKQLRQTPKLY